MNTLFENIRGRREATAEQTLLMLEMVPLSDTETRYALLSSAGRYLHDRQVAAKWMELIAGETDTRLKAFMLRRLGGLSWQQLPDQEAYLSLLASCLAQDEARDTVLYLLGELSVTEQKAREQLMAFYRQQQNADTARLILYWLLVPSDAPADTLAFFMEQLDTVDEAYKLVLVNRLLRQNQLQPAQVEKLLHPSEPDAIKQMALRYCFDRSWIPEQALCTMIEQDGSPVNRAGAIQLLATQGLQHTTVLAVVLKALRDDPHDGVRQLTARLLQESVVLTPETIAYCRDSLLQEKNVNNALQLLNLLLPHLDQNEPLLTALLQLLQQNIQTALAVWLYTAIGKLLPQRPDLFERFLAAYSTEQRDECKAAILGAITAAPAYSHRLHPFYLQALQAPSLHIRQWAVQGLLQIPLTPENIATLEAAAPVLLEQGIDFQKRLLLARKICCIPQKPTTLLAVLQQVAARGDDERIRTVCRQALEKALVSGNADAGINWQQWLHQVDVEHNLEGIFPHLWMYYADNPEMAKKICWSALNPANKNALYYAGVQDLDILYFLAGRAALDDELARYCINRLVNGQYGEEDRFNHYFVLLKNNAHLPELKTLLWPVLEKWGRNLNQVLVAELLQLVWGSALEEVFTQRIRQLQTAAALTPYLSWLSANSTWPPVPALLKTIAALPPVQEEDNKKLFQEACRNCGLDATSLLQAVAPNNEVVEGPGFAD